MAATIGQGRFRAYTNVVRGGYPRKQPDGKSDFLIAPYSPRRGKIERFFRSLRARLLRSLDGAVEVDPDPAVLTLRLQHDLREIYNHLPHEGLDQDTPHQRFTASARPLEPIGSEEQLRSSFTLPATRRVTSDGVISYDGVIYELPRGVRGKVTVQRRLLEGGALYFEHLGRWIRLQPVDPTFNATSGRGGQPQDPAAETTSRPKSASTLAYEQAFRPMTDADGGYPANDNDKE